MTLFRSELLPFHPPRPGSRIGEGLARYGRVRYGRVRAARHAQPQAERACAPHDAHDVEQPAAGYASVGDATHRDKPHESQASPCIARAA